MSVVRAMVLDRRHGEVARVLLYPMLEVCPPIRIRVVEGDDRDRAGKGGLVLDGGGGAAVGALGEEEMAPGAARRSRIADRGGGGGKLCV